MWAVFGDCIAARPGIRNERSRDQRSFVPSWQHHFFGPSLVRAYELESRLAIFPRIILDPKLPAGMFDAQDQRLQPVYKDHDGLRCINFLSPVMLHVVFRLLGMSPDSLISDLSDKIERLVGTASDEAALQKIHWLRDCARRMLGAPKPDEALVQDLVDEVRQASTLEVT